MDDISHQEGKAFAALQIGHTVVHHNLPCVDDGVGVGGVGGSPPSQVDPAPTCCSLSRNLASLITCSSLTRVLLTPLKIILFCISG